MVNHAKKKKVALILATLASFVFVALAAYGAAHYYSKNTHKAEVATDEDPNTPVAVDPGTSFSNELPAAFPSEVPIPEGAELIGASTTVRDDGHKEYRLSFSTQTTIKSMFDFYDTALDGNGWQKAESRLTEDLGTIIAVHKRRGLSLSYINLAADSDESAANYDLFISVSPSF